MRNLFTYSFILLVIISSCKKEENLVVNEEVSITPRFSVALGNFVFDMNDELSRLRYIIENMPDSLLYNDSIYPTSEILDDTITFPFNFVSISKEFDNITLLMLKLIFYNGYPTDVFVEAILQDVTGNEMFRKGPFTVPGAEVNDSFRVTEYSKYICEFNFPDTIIPILDQVTDIVFYYSVITQSPDDILVRFYDNYDIKLHVGARVQYEVGP